MRKLALASLFMASFSTQINAEECGKVTIADMNWNSATLIANVDSFILQHGYGCDTELVPGDTMPTGTSMIEKGEPDIAPEMWSNSLKSALDRGVKEGRLKFAGPTFSDGGEEGFWVPEYMVEKTPELATIAGIKKNAKLFTHPEDPDQSAFYGCPAGWNCQISSGNLFKALDLAKAGFDLIDPGSGAGLSGSIAKAYERKQPWFGYYWAPTAVLGKYKMVKVDFGSGVDAKYFSSCITNPECTDPKVTMYPPSAVDTVITTSFADRSSDAVKYLSARSFTNSEMNGLLAWMEDNQADGEAVMVEFLTNHEAIWTAWVSTDVAKKVKGALKDL
ncbi:ABC transporter substrate-binding protein [Photobacterium kishitanii]|uniref:ABC transporter substrate-binding protein n=1 Tax=Photobacterium kishitanii TaxID=318456 RepID=UPI0005D31627|nr:ABC transporter substrate-binding protein [Photobacterium kishitanii]KJG09790.1 ABC transporter substrate-binding protein [Photobacterium kishitanii]PSV07696.1 ABC transporter substrate-binding protein [Photobacterium kishitanii]PSV76184.1 ABC transporter substrate-binding protein [Photobacterium kishitanii]